jgi:hypothetical protein
MDLHPKFSGWLQAAQITPPGDAIRRWWAGVSELPVDRQNIVSLARLAYRVDPEPAAEARLVATMQKHDGGYIDAPIASSVIAAARLVVAIEEADERLASLAALAVVCAHSAGLRRQSCLDDVAARAETSLNELSGNRADWNYLRTGESDDDNDVELLRQVVGVLAEESNMLWWLFGDTSRDSNERFGNIAEEVIPFVAAKELADLTVSVPGPRAVAAFADRACRSGRKDHATQVDVATAIGALPAAWRDKAIGLWKDKPVLPLCPIAKSITASVTARGKQWPTEFSRATGWARNAKLPGAKLALLTYREFLLLKAWAESAS